MALSLAGCKKDKPESNILKYEYSEKAVTAQTFDAHSELEGKIVKVQPSIISYRGGSDGMIYGSRISANHEFEYVVVETTDKKLHTLIYPYSKAIVERYAKITYRPLPSKTIDSETFIANLINPKYATDDNIIIETEGFIAKDGIVYK